MSTARNVVGAKETPTLGLHDALALGQYESLPPTSARKDLSEVHRLPLLLRLLSTSRPLASLPDLKTIVSKSEASSPSSTSADEWVDDVVQRLEDRAALYSAAEGTEVLAGHLAPHVCRKWSKLSSLPRTRDTTGATLFDSTVLVQAAHNVTRRRKLSETSIGASSEEGNVLSEYNRIGAYDDDEDDFSNALGGNEEGPPAALSDSHRKKRRKQSSSQLLGRPSEIGGSPVLRRQSTGMMSDRELAAEDTQEALATKSWKELALLVSQSLQQPLPPSSSAISSPIPLVVDEASILAQAHSSATKTTGLMSADLSATLCSLLHHTPVLRYDHIATALCRVGLSQAVEICSRLGANTPAAVPLLVRGCLSVAHAAATAKRTDTALDEHNEDHQTSTNDASLSTVSSTAVKSVESLAALSTYEAARAATMLRFSPGWDSPTAQQLSLHLAIARGDALGIALAVDETFTCLQFEENDYLDSVFADTPGLSLTSGLGCLSNDLCNLSKEDVFRYGRAQWILVGYLRLIVFGDISTSLDLSWMQALGDRVVGDQPHEEVFRLLVVITWVVFAHCLSCDSSEQRLKALDLCKAFLSRLLSPGPDTTASTFSAYFVMALKSTEPQELGKLLHEILGTPRMSPSLINAIVAKNHLLNSSAPILESILTDDILKAGMAEIAVARDLDSASKCLGFPRSVEYIHVDQVRKSLHRILCSSDDTSLVHLAHRGTLNFIENASKFVCHDVIGRRELPVVSPLQLEGMGLLAERRHFSSSCPSVEMASMLLNVAYAICFSRDHPDSPYNVVMRNLPLCKVYICLQEMESACIDPLLRMHILAGLREACPEILLQVRIWGGLKEFCAMTLSRKRMGDKYFIDTIRTSLKETEKDPNGERVEEEFCWSIKSDSWNRFWCNSTSALLSPGYPLTTFEYTRLCSDPLTLLKAPMSCWERDGLRRVLLTMLAFLVTVNDAMVRGVAKENEETSHEMFVSRDLVIVRSLLSLMNRIHSMRSCVFTTGFLRAVFAQSCGLGAALLRQGIPDPELDWLTVNVPEIMGDGIAFQSLLGLQTVSTACHRLVAAGGVLRIAVIHGRHREKLTQSLVITSVSQLIANFFIILGPTGVPVQALVSDKEGDTTQLCRKAAMRMLKSVSYVRGSPRELRNECIIALQKLSRLCKGEEIVGGLPASVASRRKGFLREMLDGISKALAAIGSAA